MEDSDLVFEALCTGGLCRLGRLIGLIPLERVICRVNAGGGVVVGVEVLFGRVFRNIMNVESSFAFRLGDFGDRTFGAFGDWLRRLRPVFFVSDYLLVGI